MRSKATHASKVLLSLKHHAEDTKYDTSQSYIKPTLGRPVMLLSQIFSTERQTKQEHVQFSMSMIWLRLGPWSPDFEETAITPRPPKEVENI